MIWYCGKVFASPEEVGGGWTKTLTRDVLGSSKGRGTRAAGWFDDLLKDRGVSGVESVVLEGGVAGWAKAGADFTAYMDEYDAEAWKV